MPEVILVLQHIDLALVQNVQRSFNVDSFWRVQGDLASETQVILVNGQREPTLRIDSGLWYRFRTVLIGTEISGHFTMDNPSCEIQLLAKDGVYLEWIPRLVAELYLSPGSRSDFALRCTSAAASVNIMSRLVHYPPGQDPDSIFKILTLIVTPTDAPPAPDLTVVRLNRPCYLASTLNVQTVDSSHVIEFGTGGGSFINFLKYGESDQYLAEWQTGQLVEVRAGSFPGLTT